MSDQKDTMRWPFGKADVIIPALTSGAVAATVNNSRTRILMNALTGVVSGLNLTLDAGLEDGDELIVDVVQGRTGRDVTLGTGFLGPVLTGVALDRDTLEFVFVKTEQLYVAKQAAWNKIVDAA